VKIRRTKWWLVMLDFTLCRFLSKEAKIKVWISTISHFTIKHDLNMNQFSCIINASHNLFYDEIVDKIWQRFHSKLKQLFRFSDDQMKKTNLWILSNERLLMNSINITLVHKFCTFFSQIWDFISRDWKEIEVWNF